LINGEEVDDEVMTTLRLRKRMKILKGEEDEDDKMDLNEEENEHMLMVKIEDEGMCRR
jgi:hypothetical protein